ncbi:polyhydroxyalkanoate synthesis repressor PhaR [Francisellaceae bacterium]|nr:polyhydroxyalkanoate synthesis repressor PhaR [Francisellaceae bacterium]
MTAAKSTEQVKIRIIKKYPNRRLYDTAISSYITLDDVRKIVLECEPFQVIDSKSKEDITRSVLMQIINEQEEVGEKPMFTNDFLQQVIRSYGNSMQEILTGYFDNTLDAFLNQQKRIQDNVSNLIDSTNPLKQDTMNPVTYFQNVAQKNLDVWKNSWQNLSSTDKSK